MSTVIINNRYQILQSLGAGGFGETYLAEDLHLPTKPRCVVKRLRPQANDEENIQLAHRLFEQEAEVLYRLGNHPQIPKLQAHFKDNGEFFLVQDFIEGETLTKEFQRVKKFNQSQVVDLIRQVLEPLSFVHSQNVIHRDIKPSNLIRRFSDGKIFLIDFGAVKQVSFNPFLAGGVQSSTVAIGSAGYTPSEQAIGKPQFASDLYSLGLIAIESLTNIHPVNLSQNNNTGEFVWQHKASLHPELMNFIAKLVRYDYRQRWGSASEAQKVFYSICTNLGFFVKDQNYKPQPNPIPAQRQFNPLPQPLTPALGNFNSAITREKNEFSNQQIPPTVVYLPQPNLQPPLKRNEKKGALQWIWNNDFALVGAIGLMMFLLLSAVIWGFIAYIIKPGDITARQNEINKTQPLDLTDSSMQTSAYLEAVKQAEEASAIEAKASTKFEWKEVANKYQRAAMLMDSVSESSPNYGDAKVKAVLYRKSSEEALTKAENFQNTPQIVNTNPTPQTSPLPISNYPTQTSTYPTPTPIKKAKMPGKRKEKMYLAYSSSTGDYIGQGQDRVFTDRDGNFSCRVSNGRVSLRFDGGPDWWSVDFAGPQQMKLSPGSYEGAQRCAFHSPTRPGLDMSGSGRGCNQLTGNFNINNIIFSEDGTNVLLLDATFVQYCENSSPPLMGRIYYDAR